MVLLAPTPKPSETTAATVNPGDFRSIRNPNRRSCRNACIRAPRLKSMPSVSHTKVQRLESRQGPAVSSSLSLAVGPSISHDARQLPPDCATWRPAIVLAGGGAGKAPDAERICWPAKWAPNENAVAVHVSIGPVTTHGAPLASPLSDR